MWFLLILLTIALNQTKGQFDEQGTKFVENFEKVSKRTGKFLLPIADYDNPYKQPEENSEYDFIVVGSGAAGSVVANRLSENPKWKILLLETGEEPTILSDIPAAAAMFQFTNYNWGYLMEKQANFCLGLKDERMHWPRGKVLGGSSVINYMIHIRGNRLDYDRWAALGNPGWSYQEVLPYFIKSEDAHLDVQDVSFHGTGGYLGVQDIPYRSESVRTFVNAAQESGYRYVDYNGHSQLGVSFVQGTLRDGKRCSAEKAFLRPAKYRPNLTILTRARVTNVIINPTTKEAEGVQYIRNKRYHVAKASKEVILSAGAFNSPQLLILSGVGPKRQLKELGIPLIQDLPVGEKMYDHLSFMGLVFTVNESIVFQQAFVEEPVNILEFVAHGRGPVTTLGGVEALLYFKTQHATYKENYPDMEIMFISGGLHTDNGRWYRRMFRISDKVYNGFFKPLEGKFAWTAFPMLLHPQSYGWLKLKSKNPFHWPKFYGNYFTDSKNQDIKTFIAAIREVQRIAKSPAFRKYNTELYQTPIPGCENYEFDSDPYWICALRHVSATLHHQIATCKMGPSYDPEAVVDNKLKVYGIGRLRVIDTSIIPITLSAHVNVPAFMIGEKGSDIIKEYWENKS